MAILVVFSFSFLKVWPIHFHFLRFIEIATSSSEVFVCDDVWPEDTKYLAESLVDKRLYFGKQSFS